MNDCCHVETVPIIKVIRINPHWHHYFNIHLENYDDRYRYRVQSLLSNFLFLFSTTPSKLIPFIVRPKPPFFFHSSPPPLSLSFSVRISRNFLERRQRSSSWETFLVKFERWLTTILLLLLLLEGHNDSYNLSKFESRGEGGSCHAW